MKKLIGVILILMIGLLGCGNKQINKEDYIGVYLDNKNEPELRITQSEESEDTYNIQMGIFRLTLLEGKGKISDKGLEFEALDASGEPIKALITINDTKAIVEFTESTWKHINNGDKYEYTRSVEE